jgi:hypothetical protein
MKRTLADSQSPSGCSRAASRSCQLFCGARQSLDLMRFLLWLLAVVFLCARLAPLSAAAQTNAGPPCLALIAAADDLTPAADVLVERLSHRSDVKLLERDEIRKVLQEQALSRANKDYLKLGRIMGADGVLVMELVRGGAKPQMSTRLLAVKPGVVLLDTSSSWPPGDLRSWADESLRTIQPLLPKLTVLAKDAIPVSVVNIRMGVQSPSAPGIEQLLKTLIIQRLARERELFVLERQRMGMLEEEKQLNQDGTSFWSGSYLLDGIADRDGYSRETISVHFQITPPRGGAPMRFEVKGSRTNLVEVVNRLGASVREALKLQTPAEWGPLDEARQYFLEAEWALRWGAAREAQAASEAAWALGKADKGCATLQIKACLADILAGFSGIGEITETMNAGNDDKGQPIGPPMSDAMLRQELQSLSGEHPLGCAFKVIRIKHDQEIRYAFADSPPAPESIQRAMHVLDLYRRLGETLPRDGLRLNSDWHRLGTEVLDAVSAVLQSFDFMPQFQGPVSAQLGELRAAARDTADWIWHGPQVRETYFGEEGLTDAQKVGWMSMHASVYACEARFGCFWQDTPEQALALYRKLMKSSAFCFIHTEFWHRGAAQPRLAAWNDADRKRLPLVWTGFVAELSSSTNVLLRMEAKALAFADGSSDVETNAALNDLIALILTNRDELVANPVGLFRNGWGLGFRPELAALDSYYQPLTLTYRAKFEEQKRFLIEKRPYNAIEFSSFFSMFGCTRKQARELQPLVAGYRSNLMAQVETAAPSARGKFSFMTNQFNWLQREVDRIANTDIVIASYAMPQRPPASAAAAPSAPSAPAADKPVPQVASNVVSVKHFLELPASRLKASRVTYYDFPEIVGQRLLEGKLVLDVNYSGHFSYGQDPMVAVVVLDLETEQWDVVGCFNADFADSARRREWRTTLHNGAIFTSNGGHIRCFDLKQRAWRNLDILANGTYDLFAVNGRLFAANDSAILEIIEGGKSVRVLASTRRNPPASALDSLAQLMWVSLFSGDEGRLMAYVGGGVYGWVDGNWQRQAGAGFPSLVEPFDDGVLFLQDFEFPKPARVSGMVRGQNAPELWVAESKPNIQGRNRTVQPAEDSGANSPEPLWTIPPGTSLLGSAMALKSTDFYMLVQHSSLKNTVDDSNSIVGQKAVPLNGYHSDLLRFTRGQREPRAIHLRFDVADASPPMADRPVGGASSERPAAWMFFAKDRLWLGMIRSLTGTQLGVWSIPVSDLRPWE